MSSFYCSVIHDMFLRVDHFLAVLCLAALCQGYEQTYRYHYRVSERALSRMLRAAQSWNMQERAMLSRYTGDQAERCKLALSSQPWLSADNTFLANKRAAMVQEVQKIDAETYDNVQQCTTGDEICVRTYIDCGVIKFKTLQQIRVQELKLIKDFFLSKREQYLEKCIAGSDY